MFGKKKTGSDIYGVKGKRPFRDESPETGFRHSDHYHRYFRGYTEVRTEKPNGGYRLKRFYTRRGRCRTAPTAPIGAAGRSACCSWRSPPCSM